MKNVSAIDRYVIQKVKDKRNALKYSQADLSYELGTSPSFIAQVERDSTKTKYSLDRLNQIARAFKCTIYEFLPEHPL